MKTLMFIGSLCMINVAYGQWELMPLPEDCGLMSVYFTDPLHGYIAGADASLGGDVDGGIIMETFDGGETWDTLSNFIYFDEVFSKMDMIGDVGYIVGHDFAMMQTVNGGLTWTIVPLEEPADKYGTITDVDLVTPTNGYAIGADGLFYRLGDPTAIAENATSHIRIFPNPATDHITITLDKPSEVNIYNTLGEIIFTSEAGSTITIAVDNWPAGYYMAKHDRGSVGFVVR